jgi:hypothetical protein
MFHVARIEWIEQRLVNWARWRLSSGIGMLGYASIELGDALLEGKGEGYDAAPVPLSDIDGSETQQAIDKLSPDLKATIEQQYLANVPLDRKLRRLGIAKQTFYDRIDSAHRALAGFFTDKSERQKAERKRVEQLREAMRP